MAERIERRTSKSLNANNRYTRGRTSFSIVQTGIVVLSMFIRVCLDAFFVLAGGCCLRQSDATWLLGVTLTGQPTSRIYG